MTPSGGAGTPTGAEPATADRKGSLAAAEPALRRRRGDGSRPRLLFVSAGLSPRGGGIAAAGRLLLDATREWAGSRGVDLRLLTLGERDDLPPGVDGEAFAGRRGALARAVWRAQLDGYEHHVYDFLGTARIQGLLPRPLRARYLLYLHGIECWVPLRRTRRRALAGAAVRLANSAWTIGRLRQANPWCGEIAVLPLAVQPPAIRGDGDRTLLAELGEGFVLVVGRMAPGERYKGHEALLDAISRLAQELPALELVVVGEGQDRGRLEALARESGVADRVRFTGFVDEPTLAALYERCAVFAMPSAGEGFGLVYLEAMRAAKPCIALDGTAAAEIVVDGETGRLVERGAASLAAALAELVGDPRRRAELGAAGRARWEQHFHPRLFATRFASHLDELVVNAAR